MEKIYIPNAQGEKLCGILHKANDEKKIVICCHGFAGNKTEVFWPELSSQLSEKGVNSFGFDFSGHGESEGKYEESYMAKQLSDIRSVVDYFEGWDFGIVGHSRGAIHSGIYATSDKRIKFVILIGARADAKATMMNIYPEQKAKLEKGETFYWWEEKCGNRYPITPQFVNDLRSYDLITPIKSLRIPLMIVHGKEDTTVPVRESQMIFISANDPKTLRIYDRADHCFTERESRDRMIEDVVSFVTAQLVSHKSPS